MHNGELASIHSSLQQAFLTAEAAKFADEVSCLSVCPVTCLMSVLYNFLICKLMFIFLGMELLDRIFLSTDLGNIFMVR